MSSALNHLRGLSGISSLRAAHPRTFKLYKNSNCGDIISSAHHCRDLLRDASRDNRRLFHTNGSSRGLDSRVLAIDSDIQPEDTINPKHTQDHSSARVRTPRRQRTTKSTFTPSEYLSDSLQQAGHPLGSGNRFKTAAGTSKNKINFVISPKNLLKKEPGSRFVRQSLQTTLGQYIQHVDPLLRSVSEADNLNAWEVALRDVFRASNRRYLEVRGYSVDDVVAWAWILTSNDPYQAASRLFLLEADYQNRNISTNGPRVPPFIVLLLLKEDHLDPPVFRLLLIHSLHLMSGEPLPGLDKLGQSLETDRVSATESIHLRRPQVDVTTCMLLTKRLIRHARHVWPEAFPVIARSVARFLTMSGTERTGKSIPDESKDRRFRTQMANFCLSLLSLPAKIHPFRSAFMQQQAQFELLRAMASHKPVLPVTREGYRAVVAVQLAHKKTTDERQSADLKAPSWPPWKEEKLGIDAQRGNEGLHSRAMNVLSQMKEAGYSPRLWEEISSILAGWDTDGSPTVQTRSLAPPRQSWPLKSRQGRDHYLMWVARLRATRTVREAWACFLSYQDHGLPPKAAMYAAMAEKLLYRQNLAGSNFDRASLTLPGDGREVYAEPASARDVIYVRTEPPSLNQFLDEMISHDILPSGRLLALLLLSAPSLRSGLVYLHASNLTEDQIIGLCTVWRHPSEYQEKHLRALEALPDVVFGAFVKFLCKHSPLTVSKCAKDVFMADRTEFDVEFPTQYEPDGPIAFLSENQEDLGPAGHPVAFWHATQLVKLRQPPCRWAWHNLLSAFHLDPIGGQQTARTKRFVRLVAWHGICQVLTWMRARNIAPGPNDFQSLCVTFSRAIDAGIKQPELVEKATRLYQVSAKFPEADDRDHFDALVENGLSLLKAHFDQLVLPSAQTSGVAEQSIFAIDSETDSTITTPSLLHVPSYATLHSFVRAMGMVGDDDGLLHLLRWMSRSSALLNEVAEERLNGSQMMRQTLAAIRMYLQKLHPQFATDDHNDRIPSDSKLEEAYDIVSRTPGWEWPDLVEIEEYVNV
ncbi:hypothetical protein N7456_009932 [Penicillium angulare]|uniref:Uncharacterized protein n=1 Tax=Penicillium angulare TaxID=116970 RepID=A0A9W9F5N5_9EURO|nr:hypothetical protein N7456_009932 [Penicillium angulare]